MSVDSNEVCGYVGGCTNASFLMTLRDAIDAQLRQLGVPVTAVTPLPLSEASMVATPVTMPTPCPAPPGEERPEDEECCDDDDDECCDDDV